MSNIFSYMSTIFTVTFLLPNTWLVINPWTFKEDDQAPAIINLAWFWHHFHLALDGDLTHDLPIMSRVLYHHTTAFCTKYFLVLSQIIHPLQTVNRIGVCVTVIIIVLFILEMQFKLLYTYTRVSVSVQRGSRYPYVPRYSRGSRNP